MIASVMLRLAVDRIRPDRARARDLPLGEPSQRSRRPASPSTSDNADHALRVCRAQRNKNYHIRICENYVGRPEAELLPDLSGTVIFSQTQENWFIAEPAAHLAHSDDIGGTPGSCPIASSSRYRPVPMPIKKRLPSSSSILKRPFSVRDRLGLKDLDSNQAK